MKKSILRTMAMVFAMTLMLATFASCIQQGEQGIQGEPGVNGTNGIDGKSAYELAVDKGYTGTVEEWLASLVGEVGVAGQAGANGQSAYEIAVKIGYTGTETEWLASLVGASGSNGTNGKSAYELACDNGFEGSLFEWLDSLVGENGVNGTNGTNGTNGKSAYELACDNGFEGSLTEWLASLVGAAGKDGTNGTNGSNGTDGKSAYELAVEKGYEGDLQTWLASLVGTKGDTGKSAYEIAVENGYEGTEEEWLESLVGEKGDDGLSAFEIYQKYHPEYTGSEEEWIESLKGSDGEKGDTGESGKDGVSVTNAYVDENLHLWIVLSNGTKIDAGYVGVTVTPAPTTYTVTFVDYDGTTLKTETVESGEAATAPAEPTRSGYRFTGWDVAFDNITSNTTVTAQYIQQFTVTFKDYNGDVLKTQTVDKGANATPPANPTRDGYEFTSWSGTYTNVTDNQTVTATYTQLVDTRNLLEMTYVDNQDGTLTLTAAVKGDVVNLAGIEGYVSFDTSKLAYSSRTKLSSLSGSVNYDSNDSNVYFSLADSENLTEAESLFSIVLTYADAVNTQITLTITDIYDQDYNTETYTIVGGNVVIG